MKKKQIQIRIFPDGHVESVTLQMKGKECLKHLKTLETLLEARVVDSEFTSEYYEQETATQETESEDLINQTSN